MEIPQIIKLQNVVLRLHLYQNLRTDEKKNFRITGDQLSAIFKPDGSG